MALCTWQRVKEAVTDFRKLLQCSKCTKLMSEPLCLGACEHMFCRSCAGPCAGGECCVCGSPAWVKDIQINRQLSNITELFRNLETLLNPTGISGVGQQGVEATPPESQSQPASIGSKGKKRYHIWTSPRSRRIRCRFEGHGEAILLRTHGDATLSQLPVNPPRALFKAVAQRDDSVYNFPASSQDSSSSSPSRKAATGGGKGKKRKRQRKSKHERAREALERAQMAVTRKQKRRMQLQMINQQWGVGLEGGDGSATEEAQQQVEEEEESAVNHKERKRSGKRVSFQSSTPPISSGHPQEGTQDLKSHRSDLELAMSGTSQSDGLSPVSVLTESTANNSNQAPSSTTSSRQTKRSHPTDKLVPDDTDQQSTPKKMRTSPSGPGKRRVDVAGNGHGLSGLSTPPPSPSPSPFKPPQSPHASPGEVACEAGRGPRPSPCGRKSQEKQGLSSPAFMKKNHKGETKLHLASIKGDLEAVKSLLEQGADPNLKDNAGWTPLHEACNHGHLPVVEALIVGGALLNTPGYQNDSPLHDAVRNGHMAIVKLLLENGASQSVLNMFGLRAVDCAETPEMRGILQGATASTVPLNSPLTPPASLSKSAGSGHREGRITLLGSKLTQPQRRQLAQVARLLGARLADSFSNTVTHVVVADGSVPTTLSALQGVLNGCWILRFTWVQACQQACSRAAEGEHEAGEGPQRSRLNRDNLLPGLFDGCFFFLLGPFKSPEKPDLLKLIREGGGQILSRQPKPDSDVTQTLSAAAYHALPGSDQALCTQYILYEPGGAYRPSRVRLGKVWSAPSSWLLECIMAFQLLPVPDIKLTMAS